jgi:hypothetical protein
MEILVELILQVLGEVCCQAVGALLADTLFGVAAYKVHKERADRKESGEPSESSLWMWLFWILLPFVIGLTSLLVYTVIRRSAA